jgi:hypothetical protein
MDTEPKQEPDHPCYPRERVLLALDKSGTEVTNLIFQNEDVTWESVKYSEKNVAGGRILTWLM